MNASFGGDGLYGGHLGVDLFARSGTPVYAAADGVVDRAVLADMRYANSMGKADAPEGQGHKFGTNVVIRHEGGLYSLYGHLSRIVVKPHEHVTKGQLIGYSGNSGATSGPHLHFAIANSDQMWGYSGEDFVGGSFTYLGVTYYDPQRLVMPHTNAGPSHQLVDAASDAPALQVDLQL